MHAVAACKQLRVHFVTRYCGMPDVSVGLHHTQFDISYYLIEPWARSYLYAQSAHKLLIRSDVWVAQLNEAETVLGGHVHVNEVPQRFEMVPLGTLQLLQILAAGVRGQASDGEPLRPNVKGQGSRICPDMPCCPPWRQPCKFQQPTLPTPTGAGNVTHPAVDLSCLRTVGSRC